MLPSSRPPRFRLFGLAVALVLMLLLMLSPDRSAAQLLGLTWPGLGHGDLQHMEAASQKVLRLAASDAALQWTNPNSGNTGVVKVIRSFEANGMPCRTLDYTIRFARLGNEPDHYVVNWCRLPGGEWKIVELAP